MDEFNAIVTIIDWAGNILFKGPAKDQQFQSTLVAHRCECYDDDEPCESCNHTRYNDIEIHCEDESINIYECIDY